MAAAKKPTKLDALIDRDDDPEYIVRLVGQGVRVSVETTKIVSALPTDFVPALAASAGR